MGAISYGFTDEFDSLNRKTSAASFVSAAGSTAQPFAGPVHVTVVAENLDRHNILLDRVGNEPALHGGLYAGAAGFVNFGYIAKSQASAALLFDINLYQKKFWDIAISAAADCSTGEAFRDRLGGIGNALGKGAADFPSSIKEAFNRECEPFGGHSFKDLPEAQFQRWLGDTSRHSPDGRWMHDEAQYGHVHRLAKAGAIGAVTLDIGSKVACEHVRTYLDERDQDVRLLYVSNILNFLQSPVRATDFVGRPVMIDSKVNAQVNLHGWLEPEARVIECDNLTRNTPLMISGRSYAPTPASFA